MVEVFSESDETLKVAKKKPYDLGFVGCLFFCSSDEPLLATNAWVQFRVNTYFKLLHQKEFYSANVPEVTLKLAPMQNQLKLICCKGRVKKTSFLSTFCG